MCYGMTTDPAYMSGPDRERRTPETDRREPIQQDARGDPRAVDKSLEYRCRQLTTSLGEALGPDGCSALLARALTQCEPTHPVLQRIRGADGREIQLDGVPAAIEQYGYAAAEAGVDALLTSLVEILGKLIGEDMALRLLDLDAGESGRNREAP